MWHKAFLAVALAALAGCAASPGDRVPGPGESAATAPPPTAESQRTVELQTRILTGEMAIQRGMRQRAAREYVEALAYTDDAGVAQRATRIALFAGEPELAFTAARAWAKADPEARTAHKTAARLALRSGSDEQLAHHAARVVNLHPDGIGSGMRELADVLSGEPEQSDRALETMRRLVEMHSETAEAHHAHALLAMRYGGYDRAESAVDRALTLREDWHEAILLRAGLLVRQGRLDDARTWIDGLEGTASERARYRIAYARMLLDSELDADAADAFERALEIDADNSDARYGLAVLSLSLGQQARAEKALTALYESGSRRDDAAFYLGNIAENRGNYARARQWYQRVQGGAHAFDAQVRAARARYRGGDLAGARTELESLRYANPDLAERLFLAEGEMLYSASRYDAALAHYDNALQQFPGSHDLLYGRSLVYERLGSIGKAESDLRRILDAAPDNARALNALGYMLSNHSSRYDEAHGYIERAFEAEPDDPAVMDSMGWIEYRLGNLETARDYLQRAYDKLPDPEVAAHLGEVLWKLGEKERARGVWQEALDDDPDHPLLRETVDRLTP